MGQAKITTIVELSDELVITLTDQVRAVVVIVLSVNTGCDNMVAEILHNLEGQVIDVEVRGTHVGWNIAHGAFKHGLKAGHFLDDLVVA